MFLKGNFLFQFFNIFIDQIKRYNPANLGLHVVKMSTGLNVFGRTSRHHFFLRVPSFCAFHITAKFVNLRVNYQSG